MIYYAYAYAKGARLLGKYGPFDDREFAARFALNKHPTAHSIQSASGQFGNMNIQWHDEMRREMQKARLNLWQ